MPLVTTSQMLSDARKGCYAVGAFNVENMEMVMAVIQAAEELNAPAILQTTPSTVKYAGLDLYLANVKPWQSGQKSLWPFIWTVDLILDWQCRHCGPVILRS